VIASTGTASGIGAVNPLLYRGYYYDAELGMYYLQSRYKIQANKSVEIRKVY
jgi:hypothetical protein